MAVTTNIYTTFRKTVLTGTTMNLTTAGNVKAMLCTSAYTPAVDTHDFLDDVASAEVSGAGYTAAGLTMTNVTVTVDAANHRVVIDADDLSWANASFTAKYVVIYYNVGAGNSSKPIICYIDLDDTSGSSSKTVQGGTFSVTFDTTGIFAI